ncbi:hypothetical protein IWW39_005831 [Coemansia spiralis]|uniref:SMP-30/Gluconolactonase/LRE-like region domain-containing protein n=1 Tax=Coemansia spiralis TaxID=417178 RepID=A0A9W8GGT3_9FUNG|nr:hypothetical protein IWW39_005831 [Coemansia spiralis]
MRRALLSVSLVLAGVHASVPIFNAQPYLGANDTVFGALIEGAAVDRHGNFYAVDYKDDKAAVGQAFMQQKLFFKDLERADTWFNAVRFNVDKNGVQEAYLGDVTNHRVVRVRDPGGEGQFAHSEVFCQSPDILQPNDLAIAHTTGRVFLSGMRFTANSVVGDGDLWTCDTMGTATRLGVFYRTNGIEVSPDEKTLYLSEAINQGGNVVSNVVHAYDLDAQAGTICNGRVFVDFAQLDNSASSDVDGMRTDSAGNLYVSRWGAGKIAKISPAGALLAYVHLATIEKVTNLEFAGPSGRDLYAVGACKDDPTKGCIDRYSSSAQGRAFCAQQV